MSLANIKADSSGYTAQVEGHAKQRILRRKTILLRLGRHQCYREFGGLERSGCPKNPREAARDGWERKQFGQPIVRESIEPNAASFDLRGLVRVFDFPRSANRASCRAAGPSCMTMASCRRDLGPPVELVY
jgi:hypothetical protein